MKTIPRRFVLIAVSSFDDNGDEFRSDSGQHVAFKLLSTQERLDAQRVSKEMGVPSIL